MEKRSYQDLARIYQEMYQVDEAAKGKLGSHSSDNMRGARVAQGGGRLGTFTPARGIGAKKRHKNNPEGDDNRIKTYKDQAKADRKAAAMERRKEGTAKPTKLDNLLKDIKK
mgnify:CR=1 FL=1|jgi:hypothetical protein